MGGFSLQGKTGLGVGNAAASHTLQNRLLENGHLRRSRRMAPRFYRRNLPLGCADILAEQGNTIIQIDKPGTTKGSMPCPLRCGCYPLRNCCEIIY